FCLILSLLLFRLWRPKISMSVARTVTAINEKSFVTENTVLYTILGSIIFVYSLWAIAPEVQFDALNYHLAVPAKYLQSGRITEVRFFHAYFARSIELFLTVCLAIGGPATAKMWIFFMSICAALGVYALGGCAFHTRVGLWSAALFVTTPLVGWLFSTAYNDNIVALIITSSFIALVR